MDNIRFYNGPERGLPARLQPISLPQNQEELFVSLQTADLPPLGPFETPNPSREAAQHACVSPEALSLVRTPSAAETTGALSQPAPVHYEETASTSSVAHPLGRVRAARPSLSSWQDRRRRPRVRKQSQTDTTVSSARLQQLTHSLQCALNCTKVPFWEVDRIVDRHMWDGKTFYKVRWEDTWEPAENLEVTAADAVTKWEQDNMPL